MPQLILKRPEVIVYGCEASVHHEVDRADVPRLVAGQVEHRLGDVLGHGVDALEVGLAADKGQEVLERVICARALGQVRHRQRRGHGIGGHAVDAHPVAAELRGDALGEPDHGVLGRRVDVRARPADGAGHAGQRHDGAPLPRDHSARRVLHPQEHAVHVDVEHPARLREVHVADVRHLGARHAGVVHHHVQRAEPLRRSVHGAAHVLLRRHVAVDEHGALRVTSQGVAQLLPSLILDVRDADLGAVLHEEANDGLTDAGGATSDEGHLPFQLWCCNWIDCMPMYTARLEQ
uniref:Uncharacterized protein n=1 Tax=Zea mays TaxID=4577 RepID=C4JA15_MAIZE|nr:unknown [Zea mays]